MRHVVVDTDGEVLPGFHRVQRIEHGLDHCGCELLAAQPVPSAADLCRPPSGKQRRAHVQIQRFTECACLLRAVELLDVQLSAFGRSRIQRHSQAGAATARKGRTIDGPDATLTGHLRVIDPVAFAHLLTRGIGRHRSYGFGMLLLHRADEQIG